jgi:hypothetical protein
MDNKYKELVIERDKMRHVMDKGRPGTHYHTIATTRYHEIVRDIKSIFRELHNGK